MPMQRHSVDVFHDHQNLIVGPESGSERGDAGMLKRGDDLDLPQKSLHEIGTSLCIRQQDLHGLDPVGEDVSDFVDLAHSAPADYRDNLVIPDGRANFEDGVPCGHDRTQYTAYWGLATRPALKRPISFRRFRLVSRRVSHPRAG